MTLRLRVVSRLGRPVDRPIVAEFGADGGTIGRAPDCTLVLPDPGKHISRQQARVTQRDGRWQVLSLGTSNPLIVNGVELGPGRSATLVDGERIGIAEYEIVIEDDAARASDAAVARVVTPAQIIADDFDPFAEFGPDRKAGVDPAWQERPRTSPAAAGPAPADHPLAAPRTSAIDDPFAADAGAARVGGADLFGHGDPAARALDHEQRQGESLDALFGLGAGQPNADPLAGHGLPGVRPSTGTGGARRAGADAAGDRAPAARETLDPLEAIAGRGPRAAPQASIADHASALAGAMKLPEAIPMTAFGGASKSAPPAVAGGLRPTPVAPGVKAMPPPAGALDRAIVSWERSVSPQPADPFERSAPGVSPPPAVAPRPAGRPASALPATPLAPVATVTPVAPVAARARPAGPARAEPPAMPTPPAAADAGALVAAFVRGAGLAEWPGVAGGSLTPATMERLGELLRASTEGTLGLLASRQTLKRGMKAEVTLIGAVDNNPLKFAPDALSALAQLLADPPIRGFLAGPAAIRDANDDLLAHQVAFVAGVRAAMQGLIARFDPTTLEERLAQKGGLSAHLPGRRGRLWDLFIERFGELSAEAGDDFDRLFGQAFVAAYEAQLAQLEPGDGPGEGRGDGRRDGRGAGRGSGRGPR